MDDVPLQHQLLNELDSFIRGGRITVHDSDAQWYARMRERFPMGRISGIRWDAVPGAESNFEVVPHIPPEGIEGGLPVREHAATIREFLGRFAARADVRPNDNIIVVGDGVTEIALEMPFSALLDAFPVLFSYPQHTYVMPVDVSWCFAFTFEFDMYFGKSTKLADHSSAI